MKINVIKKNIVVKITQRKMGFHKKMIINKILLISIFLRLSKSNQELKERWENNQMI